MITACIPPQYPHMRQRPRQGQSGHQAGLSRRDFELACCEHAARLLAVARRIVRSEEDAADAVQDALYSAFVARHSYGGNASVYTWLYRIVVNVCLMKLRSQRRAKTIPLDDLLPTRDNHGHPEHPTLASTERAEVCVERQEACTAVRACINRLPDDHRTILMLRDIEELDTDETAHLLKLSRSAVKTRLHRARRALRTLLEPVFADVQLAAHVVENGRFQNSSASS